MSKRTILLIEDDALMREAIRIELEDAGYVVLSKEDGVSGLEAAQTESPDLILLDMVLPQMNGFDLLRELKASKNESVRKIPVVILTNLSQDQDRERGMKLGAVDYFVKATTGLETLKEKVNALIAKGAS